MAGRLATGTLASRGARNPDALAAFIASRHRNGSRTIGLAMGGASADNQGDSMTCPRCGYSGGRESFGGGSGSDGDSSPLRTPAPSTGYIREGAPLTVRSSSAGLASETAGIELAAPRYPVTSPADLLISRRPEGGTQVRHRRGGSHIGDIMFSDEKGWQAVYGGRALKSHAQSRPALAELITTWNTGTASLERPAAGQQLQPPPVQTPLMQQYGVPAIRALATPSAGVSDGPRTTSASPDNDEDDSDGGKGSGLTPKGQAIKKKLMAKGWPDAKADMFARRAQSFGGSKS